MSSSPTSSSNTESRPGADDVLGPMLDVRCPVDFVLGNGVLTIRDCLRLEWHSVLPLAQSAGSDLVVSVHGVPIASGEVVIVDDTTALRISHMLPPPGLDTP